MNITKEWLEKQNACSEGVEWFVAQKETDGVEVLKKLIDEDKLNWANWLIVRLMERTLYISYAVYAAEQVTYLWNDKYPKEYSIWKRWVDDGRPDSGRDAAEDAAWAAGAAGAAWAAARAAAEVAGIAAGAAWAAGDAGAAADAAWAAAEVAGATVGAAWAARAAARGAMLKKILNYGIELLTE